MNKVPSGNSWIVSAKASKYIYFLNYDRSKNTAINCVMLKTYKIITRYFKGQARLSRVDFRPIGCIIVAMQKIKDILVAGDGSAVRNNFEKIADNISLVSSQIRARDSNDVIAAEAQRLLRYAAKQITALSRCGKSEIDVVAWRARNLFEALLTFKYVIRSNENAMEFFRQRGRDEKDILEALLKYSDALESKKLILERISEIDSAILATGDDGVKIWRTPILAEWVDMKDEYESFYKLYSKYVHPSSWIINAEYWEQGQHWEILLITAQLYANACLGEGKHFQSDRENY